MDWDLLAGVPEEDVRLLLQIARRRRFSRGEVVFHRDDPADSLHLIQKGRFAVRITAPLGDVVTVAVRGPGQAFGELALVAEAPRRAATVAALEEGETFAVYQGDFERIRREHPEVDRVLIASLAAEVRLLDERLVEALYVSANQRVLRRLLELAEVYDATIPLTQEVIAELAGTSRATVNRVLNEEEKRGTVALRRGKTTLLDPESLARRARVSASWQ
jgi:CRP/FNR family cyclic AMP-dependent transcriptional regulator